MDIIPDAALLHIFREIPVVPGLIKLSIVCKRWHILLMDPSNWQLWRSLTLDSWTIPEYAARRLVEHVDRHLSELKMSLQVPYYLRGGKHLHKCCISECVWTRVKKKENYWTNIASPVKFLGWISTLLNEESNI
mmetsp:Transcript_2936/g.7675  ORF Transcript_2936/g.7675 Transcript_2936/m.7675 type:complete len:134 (-) Transcript_2936:506-907(-)